MSSSTPPPYTLTLDPVERTLRAANLLTAPLFTLLCAVTGIINNPFYYYTPGTEALVSAVFVVWPVFVFNFIIILHAPVVSWAQRLADPIDAFVRRWRSRNPRRGPIALPEHEDDATNEQQQQQDEEAAAALLLSARGEETEAWTRRWLALTRFVDVLVWPALTAVVLICAINVFDYRPDGYRVSPTEFMMRVYCTFPLVFAVFVHFFLMSRSITMFFTEWYRASHSKSLCDECGRRITPADDEGA